ncbi:hypothetical protein [Rhizobium leguminosarum]|uniref:hypothetical protein n=1 Tax=Rhizobium leguminosarum TaxID=384 RepID=UPI003D6EC393
MDPKLLNLPWVTLLILAAGYMGYFVAHVGLREHHKTVGVTFNTLVFGFCAAFAYQLSRYMEINILAASGTAVVTSVLLGAVWRALLRPVFYNIMQNTNVSYADDIPTAWLNLFGETNVVASQLLVRLKDGRTLMCSDLHRFKDEPNGPFRFGATGDILMYVTDLKVGYAWSTIDDVFCDEWGSEITYIPASEVAQVNFRRRKRRATS